MSRIYAYTSPARGHIYPLVPILAELAERGHEVRVLTLESELQRLRELGIDARPISPEIEARPIDDFEAGSDKEALARTLDTFLARAPYELADLERMVGDRSPDLMLTDINCFGAPAFAEAAGLSWAGFAPFFTWVPSSEVPPFGPGMKPVGGALGRLRNRAIWGLMTRWIDRGFLERTNELRAGAGAGPLGSLFESWTRPPKLLYMTVRALEYERSEWPENFRFIGPTTWDPPADAPAWLADVDRPLVLLTASTEYQADEELIRTGLEALAGEDLFVVATTAGNDPALFSPPANARVERFLPHGPLLERAEAVICHGGMGITQKALAAGVPVCTVGWGRDQLESGRRVETAAAGVLLPRKKLTAGALRDALTTARGRRAGAERIARAMAEAPGAPGAADELEALLPVAA